MPVLITSNFDDDSIKNERASMGRAFSYYKSMGNLCNDTCYIYYGPEAFKMSHLMSKSTKWHVRPAKTQVSLVIRPV